jgi:predicted phage tail protein
MKRIILYGHLRAKFGKEFELEVSSPAEAIRALCAVMKGFRQHLLEFSEPGYRILVGKEARGKDDLHAPFGHETIKIVPVVAGASGNFGQILLGAALIAFSIAVPYLAYEFGGIWSYMMMGSSVISAVGTIGTAMALGGVAGLLSKSPSLDLSAGSKGPDDTPAYSFNGPHMTVGQGNPVPVLLGGPLRIGGALISMGISTEAWVKNGLGGLASDETGTPSGNGGTAPWVWAKAPV